MDIIHQEMMRHALEEARGAGRSGEVPVGAVLVSEAGKIIARGANMTLAACDPTAHAEIVALRKAARLKGNYRLLNTTLYVTIEPCVMCMGAIVHARIATLVYGAEDPRWGAAGSLYDFAADTRLNHRPNVIGGIEADQARALMQGFFKSRRSTSNKCIQGE